MCELLLAKSDRNWGSHKRVVFMSFSNLCKRVKQQCKLYDRNLHALWPCLYRDKFSIFHGHTIQPKHCLSEAMSLCMDMWHIWKITWTQNITTGSAWQLVLKPSFCFVLALRWFMRQGIRVLLSHKEKFKQLMGSQSEPVPLGHVLGKSRGLQTHTLHSPVGKCRAQMCPVGLPMMWVDCGLPTLSKAERGPQWGLM